MHRRIRNGLRLLGAAVLLAPGQGLAQKVEEDNYYEPFDPNAQPLVFREPAPVEIEFFSTRTNSREKVRIDPQLLGPQTGLEFYMFRVGQADAMLVVGPAPQRRTMLVDLGVASEGPYTGPFSAQHVGQRIIDITGKRSLDYLVLSHFHTDHFGSNRSGVTALINQGNFSIGTMIDTGPLGANYVARKPAARDYIALQAGWVQGGKVGQVARPRFGTGQIDLGGGTTVDVVAFAGRAADADEGVHARYERARPGWYANAPASENDLSIAMKISLGDFEFWTAGDLSGAAGNGSAPLSGSGKAYTNVEYPLTQRWRTDGSERDVEVYRASHHGSAFSSTPQLLAALDPEVVLYSALSGHGHPTPDMVKRGATTVAVQYATGIDPAKWPDATAFARLGGQVVDEIRVFVAPDGRSYTVNGRQFRAFTDAGERSGADSQP